MKDSLFFLRQWATAPLRTAAVAPSGRALAKIMTRDITPATGAVIELGPGTGVFTRALCGRGVAECDITLVELNPDFATLLKRRFPQARILQMSAADIPEAPGLREGGAGAVLSGLGLLSMPTRQVVKIMQGAFRCLALKGGFYQFTYGSRCPVSDDVLNFLGLQAERIGGTFFNLPPASVYRITRAPIWPNEILDRGAAGASRRPLDVVGD
ncbi:MULTISPECIES: methyltransferase domain-containing protein [unclassified Rhizobium]|uniref:class I SAM-dependent methyltransferase n=1 Tax=unclassified Rhizobium TaxID=2613769 RepID=UPI000EA901AE|nr:MULTISPECIES: methyltransferase domain-containing protein [unclassified Rhizobium]AYG64659.1 methyltransferase domain-containing protein [Rhizobium sp. CCGE531]AYG71141.1 methyltransferase domain-containing protein [Rhizobium sp. CCGE532]